MKVLIFTHKSDIVCLYSDNDPYVKFDVEKDFTKNITDKEIVISGGDHLNSEFGYDEFRELLKFI